MADYRVQAITAARFALVTGLGWVIACSDNTGTESDRACSAPVRVQATRSVTPVVSWSPPCLVNQVVIHEGGPNYSLGWASFFSRPPSNSMLPPIEYGVSPAGASQLPDNPVPLTAGTEYIVELFVSDSASVVFVGSDTIVP